MIMILEIVLQLLSFNETEIKLPDNFKTDSYVHIVINTNFHREKNVRSYIGGAYETSSPVPTPNTEAPMKQLLFFKSNQLMFRSFG